MAFLFLFAAWQSEAAVTLKEGPGKNLAANYCQICHSLDYIEMNAKFLGEKGWTSEVDKMVKAYGAPVPAAEIPPLVKYLSTNY